ncbi:MAG: alcohol dehydrogenase catalytic domain-containing protein [Bacteroidales bacterium]|nr:alcohol dehydrogenase catalytic domain-containing protein [Bacteroidales bacterium]
MKAAVLEQYKKFVWKDAEKPSFAPNEVLIKVSFAGVCGSDQHIFLGEFHPRTSVPMIPGHEFAGIIVEAGSQVKNFKVGDQVAVDPILWCGKCPACEIGHYPACTSLKLIGVDMNGGFGQYINAPEHTLYLVDKSISPKHAALVEVLSIGFHSCKRAGVKENDTIVIWGAGKVGQCILQAARTKTKNTLIMVDMLEERLQRAKKAYPDIHTINVLKENPVVKIKDLTNNKGVDIAFEAVGHFKELDDIVNPIRGCVQSIRGAGTVTVLGLSDHVTPVLFKELIWKEAKIVASRVSHGEFAETIENMKKGTLKPDALVSDVLPASEAQKAFEMLESEPEKHLKILLEL